jgi:hypothetical protein
VWITQHIAADSKSSTLSESEGSTQAQGKTLKIYLPHGQIHSTWIQNNRTLKDIIEKLCDTRPELNIEKYHIRDKNGNDLDLLIQLTDLKLTEIDFSQPRGDFE